MNAWGDAAVPDRYLREALLLSDRWNDLHDADAQLMFVRLILVVDDFGVFDGRTQVIANETFPRNLVGEEIVPLIQQLTHAGLIIQFINHDRPFIAIMQWSNDLVVKRDFPAPPINNNKISTRYRGKYGKQILWQNPDGFDDVSILLDVNGAIVDPQPPEWRRTTDWSPLTHHRVGERHSHWVPVTGSQSLAASHSQLARAVGIQEYRNKTGVEDGTVTGSQSLAASTTPANGMRWTGEKFEGLTEEQELSWQQAFDGLALHAELDHAAAWLKANPQAVPRDPDTIEAFLVRWFLRSARGSTVPTRGATDS